jgi:hypothetical protein
VADPGHDQADYRDPKGLVAPETVRNPRKNTAGKESRE